MKTSKLTSDQKYTQQLVNKLLSLGYVVYLAQGGTYGFFHRPNETKYISFQIDYFFFNFSANHKSQNLGTGYRITSDEQCKIWDIENFCTKDFCEKLLNCPPYTSRRKNEKFLRWSTVEEHLNFYGPSSKYKLCVDSRKDKSFKFSFTGRKNNSQGITYKISAVYKAKDINEAYSKLYNDYEHITFLKCWCNSKSFVIPENINFVTVTSK